MASNSRIQPVREEETEISIGNFCYDRRKDSYSARDIKVQRESDKSVHYIHTFSKKSPYVQEGLEGGGGQKFVVFSM